MNFRVGGIFVDLILDLIFILNEFVKMLLGPRFLQVEVSEWIFSILRMVLRVNEVSEFLGIS